MKIYYREANHDYQKYFFPYTVEAFAEEKDDISKIYEKGFLPYRNRKNRFYLARSCRSKLANFNFSSENRRILRKTTNFSVQLKDIKNFDFNFKIQKKCKNWANQRGWKISTTSLKYLFSGSFFNKVMIWRNKEKTIGYQIIYENKDILHTAYVFYEFKPKTKHLVNRMLLEAGQWASKNQKKYHYLGTFYGQTGYYKRSQPGFEYFNGEKWTSNLKKMTLK